MLVFINVSHIHCVVSFERLAAFICLIVVFVRLLPIFAFLPVFFFIIRVAAITQVLRHEPKSWASSKSPMTMMLFPTMMGLVLVHLWLRLEQRGHLIQSYLIIYVQIPELPLEFPEFS